MARNNHGGASRFVTVPAPMSHDGVGKALRSAYTPSANGMPADMMALLARLD